VKEIRAAIETAQERLRNIISALSSLSMKSTVSTNQQDALLPWVKSTVILIGATTENPYFEVNKALVSRASSSYATK